MLKKCILRNMGHDYFLPLLKPMSGLGSQLLKVSNGTKVVRTYSSNIGFSFKIFETTVFDSLTPY